MDIDEVKALKAETESKIAKLILDFQTETGAYLSDVSVQLASNINVEDKVSQVSLVSLTIAF